MDAEDLLNPTQVTLTKAETRSVEISNNFNYSYNMYQEASHPDIM